MNGEQCDHFPPCTELRETMVAQGRLEERMSGLDAWQTAQNGHLKQIDSRLDRFLWFLVCILTTSVGTLLVALARLVVSTK